MATTRLLTVREVAERIRVSEWTVTDWLRKGQLRGMRPGGTKAGWRIAEADLDDFLAARANIPAVRKPEGEVQRL